MIKKICILMSFICLLNCKKDNELIIEQGNKHEGESTKLDSDDSHKPLLSVSPEDKIIILVRSDAAPDMYLGEDGELHGFYVDLERLIMKQMGQKYEFLPYDDLGPVYFGIKTGLYHIALAAPYSPDYLKTVNISIPYEVLDIVTFVKSENRELFGKTKEDIINDFSGLKVGVQVQGHVYQALREYDEIELIDFETTTKALEALDKGIVDAVPDVRRVGLYYAKKYGWDIVPLGEPILNLRVGTAFSKALDNSLINRYNEVLKELMESGKVKELWDSSYSSLLEYKKP